MSAYDALPAPFPWWGGKAAVARRVRRAVGPAVAHLERRGLVTVERGKGAPLVTVTDVGRARLSAAGGAAA